MFWSHLVELEIVNYFDFHIHALVKGMERQDEGLILGIYGWPKTNERHLSWELLSRITLSNDLPWCVIGEFNEIISQDEEVGRRLQPIKQMESFH